MACYFCRHFDEGEERDDDLPVVESVERATGACTLSPDWRRVTGLHYCSQFSPRDASLIGMWWRDLFEGRDAFEAEKDRRKTAEKKAKDLRRKLREKGGRGGDEVRHH